MKNKGILVLLTVVIIIGAIGYFYLSNQPERESTELVSVLVRNLERPWDIKKSDDGTIFFTQRQKGLYRLDNDNQPIEIYQPEDLYNAGEGGMLGFDLDPSFSDSRDLYACFNTESDGEYQVMVAKLTLSKDFSEVEVREDIISDIPANVSGRHSGCRVRFQNDDVLWITTGDAADGNNPQDPESLAGKILRVDKQGNGIEGNMEEPFDPRIFSYGHRNIQGIVVFNEYDEDIGWGYSSEHGPTVDDEINPLQKGNFGWDPGLPYDESVPMTDTEKYPDAIESLWSSGSRTIAVCGLEYIQNTNNEDWNNTLFQSALKDSYILQFEVNNGQIEQSEKIIESYGRIRQVYQAEDGTIYFTTDNQNNDIIGILNP